MLDQLSRMQGAFYWEIPPTVSVPASRSAVLAMEAVASPETVHPSWTAAKRALMAPDPAVAEAFLTALERSGGRPSALAPHQVACCSVAWANGRGILNASEQGTGKTRSTLALVAASGAKRSIVVAPPSVCVEWPREARREDGLFGGSPPFRAVSYAHGPIDWRIEQLREWLARGEPFLAAVNYESLPRLWPAIAAAFEADAVDFLIVDESHRVKSPTGKISSVVSAMAMAARMVSVNSGTPIGNDVGDLYQQADFVAPKFLARGYGDFMSRYAITTHQQVYVANKPRMIPKVIGARDIADLMSRLAPFYYRALGEEVLGLPPATHETVSLKLPPEVARLYKDVAERGEEVFDPLSLKGALTRDVRLQQIASGFCPVLDDPDPTRGITRLASPKMEWLERFAKDRLKDDPTHRVVVWCRFTETIMRATDALERILGRGGRVSYVIGGCPWTDDAIDSLNSRDPRGVQVIVAQVSAIAEGKQMPGANTVVRYENNFSYILRAQSDARTRRMGGGRSCHYVELVAEGTIDEQILKALAQKRDFASTMSPGTL